MSAATVGALTLEPLDLGRDLDRLHAWVTHPRSRFWQMQGASRDDVAAAYAGIAADPHHHALLGRCDGEPQFLVELYDPAHSELRGLPELRPGDLGMHLLVAPTERPRRGFTRSVMHTVVRHCLADAAVQRVVVEPDVDNAAIARLNAAAGFRVLRQVPLEGKTAALSVLTREDAARSELARDLPVPAGGAPHLCPDHLATAQRHLVAKAISELAHERLLAPRLDDPPGPGSRRHVLATPDGRTVYRFGAEVLPLEHWLVDESSLVRERDGVEVPLDAQELVVELAPALGIPPAMLPTYLEELAATLAGATWKLAHRHERAAELVEAGHQQVEAAMTEGHPGFVANNGRIGLGLDEHAALAPETGRPVRLELVAARRALTRLSLGRGLTEQALYDAELDPADRRAADDRLRALGLDPADYLLLPLHPWQWQHKVAVSFAPDVARRDLVHLGTLPDDYQAQQSIRTFANTTRPDRAMVKTALAVQNMGFVRGLSPAYMEATPAINDWVHDVVAGDPTLRGCGFEVLRERAAIGYTGDVYHRLAEPSPHRKMIAALWRESPVERLQPGERLATMAALLHRDRHGASYAGALVARSGGDAGRWLRGFLRAYLRPVLHCLVRHDLAFMPHGENLMLVLRDGAVQRVLMKDIGEEVAVLGEGPLPPEVERIRHAVPEDHLPLPVLTDVVDGFLRHLVAVLHADGLLAADDSWALVRGCVLEHAADHPELAERIARYDVLRPELVHSCLNRLQLRNHLQMVDLADPAGSLASAGMLANPLAR